MAAMGGMAPTGEEASPDALLEQIRSLLDQYLALGPDTPVATEAQNLATAIDGVEADAGQEPGGMMMTENSLAPPTDNTALAPGEQGYSGPSMGDANAAAKDFLKKRNMGQGR